MQFDAGVVGLELPVDAIRVGVSIALPGSNLLGQTVSLGSSPNWKNMPTPEQVREDMLSFYEWGADGVMAFIYHWDGPNKEPQGLVVRRLAGATDLQSRRRDHRDPDLPAGYGQGLVAALCGNPAQVVDIDPRADGRARRCRRRSRSSVDRTAPSLGGHDRQGRLTSFRTCSTGPGVTVRARGRGLVRFSADSSVLAPKTLPEKIRIWEAKS